MRHFKSKEVLLTILSCVVFLSLVALVQNCSVSPSTKNIKDNARSLTPVPISNTYVPPTQIIGFGNRAGLALLDDSQGLDLLTIASSINVSVAGCASGFTIGATLIQSGVVNLYKFDQSCLVKLESFVLGTTTYSATATGATNFTTWLAGDTAIFANTISSSDTIKVFVASQVTQGGVTNTDTIAYNFTDISGGSINSIAQANVSFPVPLTVTGHAAPPFTLSTAKFVQTNADGSVSMAFTLQCTSAVTGSSGAYSCGGVPLTQFYYVFGKDNYSQGVITVTQANALFSGSPTQVTSGFELGTSAADPNGGSTVTNGGFYTGSLVTGTVAVYPSNLNNLLMIQERDGSGNAVSYLYFYIDLASLTES